jgi:hypothetical protein
MRCLGHSRCEKPERWTAEALTMIQEHSADSRRVLLPLPPAVFVDATWRLADVALEGEWEFRMHIVEYTIAGGETFSCAVLDTLAVGPFFAWCNEEWEMKRRVGGGRVRMMIQSRRGQTLNLAQPFRPN